MAATMTVDVVSPEQRLFEGTATAVYARSVEGEIGVLPGHVPVLLELAPSALTVEAEDGRQVFAVDGGFLEYRGQLLTVLTEGAQLAGEIDASDAQAEVERLEREVGDEPTERERRRLRVARSRVEVAREHG